MDNTIENKLQVQENRRTCMRALTFNLLLLLLFIMVSACHTSSNQVTAMQWNIAAKLPAESPQDTAVGVAGPVTGMHNNVLVIAGGANFPDAMPWDGGKKVYHRKVYLYKQDADEWILIDNTAELPFELAYPANCSTDRGIIVAGGENQDGISSKVLRIVSDPSAALTIDTLPDLPEPLANATAACFGSRIYIAGGENQVASSGNFYMLDLDNPEAGWIARAALPVKVSHAVLLKVPGEQQLLLCGGRMKNDNAISEFYSSVFRYHIAEDRWEAFTSLPYPLAAGTGIVLDKQMLLLGGDKGETFNRTEKLIMAIQQEGDSARRQTLTREKNALQEAHPGFSREILMYDQSNSVWKLMAQLPFNTPVTTTALQYKGNIIIPSGEVRAGVRTANIYRGKPTEQ